ncbi:MAG: hypothetical protein ABEJ74_06385 [Haloferacaceae archaeon]
MASRGSPHGDDTRPSPPADVPFELPGLTRLSWELGSRVVGEKEATLRGEWEHTADARALSVFEVTTETAIVRLRTPVGRERFFGAAQMDLEAALPRLDDSPEWSRRN